MRGERGLHLARLAGEERRGLVDELAVARLVDAPDARSRAALDLVEQARPGARREHRVRARAQQERTLQRGERLVDRAPPPEGAEILAVLLSGPPLPVDPREL